VKFPRLWFTQAHTLHRVVQIDARRIFWHTLLLGLLFSVLLAIPFVIYQQAESANRLAQLQIDQERAIKLARNAIHQEMDAVLSDLHYLSSQNELKDYLANPSPGNRLELARGYRAMARQTSLYDQIRYIGLDGMEAVRVNFNQRRPEIVPDALLQDKRDRYYFQEMLWLSPGQIYVSPLDPNVEHDNVIDIHNPVMRFGTPVADSQGLIRGMVVLNYMGQHLRNKLAEYKGQESSIWLLDSTGNWLFGPAMEDERDAQFPGRALQRHDRLSPRLWQQMETKRSGVHQSEAAWIRYERINPLMGTGIPDWTNIVRPTPAQDPTWVIAVALSRASMQAAGSALRKKLAMVYAVLAGFAFLAAGIIAFVVHRNGALTRVMEQVVDHLPVMIAYVDAEQRYRFNNMAYHRVFGLSPKAMYGKTLRAVMGEATYLRFLPYVQQTLAGNVVSFETQLTYQGTEVLDMAVTYLPDFSRQRTVRGFYAMVNDITLLKGSERRERQRILEMAQISRMTSMQEMAAEIAHEINQPLAAMAMYSEAGQRILEHETRYVQVRTWLKAINTQAKRASDVVRRVRRFVQKDDSNFASVDLNQAIRDAALLLEHEAQSQGLAITLDLAPDLPAVHGGQVLLEQVIFNLGRRALLALAKQAGTRHLSLTTRFDRAWVHVEVRDTGLDLDPALGDQIFDSFLTSMEQSKNMGLILSRTIIEAHAGTLRYVPNPGGGTVFMFSLAREDGQ